VIVDLQLVALKNYTSYLHFLGRKAAEAGEGDGPVTKRARVEDPEISGYVVQWEWEGDKGVWTQYSESMNGDITEAFNNKKKTVNHSSDYSNNCQ
jgi:hypothetical protein